MDTCKQCGVEISPAEGYYNNNVCNACAFGLPDNEVAFGGSEQDSEDDPYISWDVEYADVAWQLENPIE